jgi:hypothetical protein
VNAERDGGSRAPHARQATNIRAICL